jgi:hypothetical protein
VSVSGDRAVPGSADRVCGAAERTPHACHPRRQGAPVATAVDWDELDRLSGATDLTVTPEPLRVLG